MKIVCDNKIPFLKGTFEPYADVVYLPGHETTAQVVHNADAIITRTRTICNEALLKGSTVKIIATATIGYDHIDTTWCQANNIEWINAPGCNSWSVRQYIGSLLVSLAKKYQFDCCNTTLGVVGVGNVGAKVAEIAGIMGFRVLLNDPPRARREKGSDFVSLDTILAQSDIITCHTPLIKEGPDATYHLIDSKKLAKMRTNQILINTSRGQVVDNQALKETLKNGAIKAACLDVWENEPSIDTDLMESLFAATPHIAGYSLDGKANGTLMSVRAVARKLDLPLKEWSVKDIPPPKQAVTFCIDATQKTDFQVVSEAILHTYNIMDDDIRLRADVTGFEKQRSDYPVRREFPAFTINLINSNEQLARKIRALGFRLT